MTRTQLLRQHLFVVAENVVVFGSGSVASFAQTVAAAYHNCSFLLVG